MPYIILHLPSHPVQKTRRVTAVLIARIRNFIQVTTTPPPKRCRLAPKQENLPFSFNVADIWEEVKRRVHCGHCNAKYM
jgi:hypothetical protein